jgi:polysaccharide biosynthesis protein PelF
VPQPTVRHTDPDAQAAGLRVLLITESTYPFHFGGVSSWCRNLITGLPAVDFHVLALIASPDLAPVFELPANVSGLTTLPIWEVRDAREMQAGLRRSDVERPRPAPDDLAAGLGRPLAALVSALFSPEPDPAALAQQVHALYEFFLANDFDASMRSEVAWQSFIESAQASFPEAARTAGYSQAPIGVSDALTGLHWLYHWLLPLSRQLPAADVAHATMAGEAVLPAVAAKLHTGAGMVFSEHGVYLREIYLREAGDDGSLFLKLMKVGFARRTSEMAYALADQISTCCDYNKRWALRNGAAPERLHTIHYGVDGVASNGSPPSNGRGPVILWLGRIHPLKDIETLLRAAAIVHGARKDVLFRLYGSASLDQSEYRDQLLALRSELGLDQVVELPGYTSDPQAAYDQADIVVLTSISEGFPYATLEAMQCGKPVVATAVGGLPEQVGDCGVLVEPQQPEELAAALIQLVDDPDARERMGGQARERVRELFSLEDKNRQHFDAYVAAAEHIGVASDGHHRPFAEGVAPVAGAEDAVEGLIDDLSAQIPLPVDEREITAVLEAGGVTDAIARTRYGAQDTFALAAAIFPRLRSGNAATALRPHLMQPQQRTRRRTIPHAADGLLLLFPAAVLLIIGHWVRSIHGWSGDTSRALLWGVTVSTVLGNTFVFAIMRRGALLIGCDRWSATRRFISRWSAAALISLLLADLLAVLVAHFSGLLSIAASETFGLSFAALIALWILTSTLFLVRRAYEVGLATLTGVGVGVACYYAAGAGSGSHLEIALAAGYVVAIVIVAARVVASVARRSPSQEAPHMPRLSFLFGEAAPFAVYGGLLVVIVLGPNLVTALRAGSDGSPELRSVALGMTLALVPLMLSVPLAENCLVAFSEKIAGVLSDTSIAVVDRGVAEPLRESHRQQSLHYVGGLSLLSLVAVPVLWALAHTSLIGGLGVHSKGPLMLAFVISLIAFVLLALAQFELMLPITMAAPGLALRCVVVAVGVTAIVAAIAFAGGFTQAGPVSLIVGTCTFAAVAMRTSTRFIASAPLRLVGAM